MIGSLADARYTFVGELAARVQAHPDKVFLCFDDTPLTFAEAQRHAELAAGALLKLGINRGDTVAMLTLNCPEWVAVWFGATQIGALTMPINVMFRGDFLRHQLVDSRARLILIDAMFLPQLAEVAADLPDLDTVLVRGDAPADVQLAGIRVLNASVLGDHAAPATGDPLAWNEPACLFYTSGTTGASKGVVLTQHYLCTCAAVLGQRYGMTGDDVMYAAVPLFHVSGAQGVVLGSLMSGRTAVLDSVFSVSKCWERIRKHQASVFFGVGAMLMMLWALPPDPADADLPFRLLIAVPIPAELHRPMEERYHCRLVQAYGLTEAMLIASHQTSGDDAPGSAGKPSPLYEVRLLDDDDAEVPVGQVGEIAIRPRYPHVMFEGYLSQPEATLAQFRNLWFHTGDNGRFDEQGNLWFVDRKKDAIRRRGENISSVEVERSVLTHPAVAECAAHAVPSSLGEDDVKVCVVLRDGATIDAQGLIDHCVERMPRYAVPRYVEFLDALPKNAVGRVQKHLLRDRPIGPETWDRDTRHRAGARL
jgi:carnitine-CoA ligase